MLAAMIDANAADAAFLWRRRDAAARAPHHDLRTLTELDERVEAHLDGLRIAGDAGWAACESALDDDDPGTVFVATVIAVERGDLPSLAALLERAAPVPALSRGLEAALSWLPLGELGGILPGLLGARAPELRRVGIAACAAHRSDPGSSLTTALLDADSALRARALRAVGELGRRDLVEAAAAELGAEDPACRFAAAWSGAILGAAVALPVLETLANGSGLAAERACDLLVRCLPSNEARTFLERLAREPGRARTAAIGAGALGDPALVPWLVRSMETPELARAAGEAFNAITGLEIAGARKAECPAGYSPEELAEKDVLLDPDVDLEWPAAKVVEGEWAVSASGFTGARRYSLGDPVTPEQLARVLREGKQPHRAGAAVELAMNTPGAPLFEVRAPGGRQRDDLGVRGEARG